MRPILATLAVLGPLAVVWAAWAELTVAPTWTPSATVTVMDHRLEVEPQAVVVGPSIARTDVDEAVLRSGLGLTGPVVKLSQPQADASIWYAILKNRVYDHDLRPELVVLVATVRTLLSVAPRSGELATLTQHFAEPDAVLAAKSLSSGLPRPLFRAMAARSRLRDPWVAAARGQAVGWCFGDSGASGAELVTAAAARVLAAPNGGEQVRAIPVVEEEDGDDGAGQLVAPAAGFLPDIAALVAAHGGRLVVVLPPSGARRAEGFHTTPAAEAELVALANDLHIAWVDARNWGAAESDFDDGLHMTADAARRFSEDLASTLVDNGALGPGPPAPAPPPAPTALRSRAGPEVPVAGPADAATGCEVVIPLLPGHPPADAVLAAVSSRIVSPYLVHSEDRALSHANPAVAACSGRFVVGEGGVRVSLPSEGRSAPVVGVDQESNWVFPGGTLTWRFASAWPEGAAELTVETASFGASGGFLEVGGTVVALPAEPGAHSLRVPVPDAASLAQVRVRSPEKGAWIAVLSLSVAAGPVRSDLVRPLAGTRTGLLRHPVLVSSASPPLADAPLLGGRGNRRIASPFAGPADCPPVVVTEAGVPMPSSAFKVGFFSVTPADGSDPVDNGRVYGLAWSGSRECGPTRRGVPGRRAWIFPGDSITSQIALPGRRAPVGSVVLLVQPGLPAELGTLTVDVEKGGERLARFVGGAGQATQETRLALSRVIAPEEGGELTARLTLSPDAPPLLVNLVAEED